MKSLCMQEDVRGSNLDKGYKIPAKMVEATKDRVEALKRGAHRGHDKMTKGKGSAESLFTLATSGLFNQILLGHSSTGIVADHGHGQRSSVGTVHKKLHLYPLPCGQCLRWSVPCTRNYSCIHCPVDNASNGVFFPRMSASLHLVTCADPNCETIFGQNTELVCQNCTGSLKKLL